MRVKTRVAHLVALVVVGLFAGMAPPSYAAAPKDYEVNRLLVENRVAGIIAGLDLTADQKTQLKDIITAVKQAREGNKDQLVSLLNARRDALLKGDDTAIKETSQKLMDLRQKSMESLRKTIEPFANGLTERQRLMLGRIVPVLVPAAYGDRKGPQVHGLRGEQGKALPDKSMRAKGPRMNRPHANAVDSDAAGRKGFGGKGFGPHAAGRGVHGPERWGMMGPGGDILDVLLNLLNQV